MQVKKLSVFLNFSLIKFAIYLSHLFCARVYKWIILDFANNWIIFKFEGFNNEEEEEDEFEHMSTKGRGAKEKPKPKAGSQGPQTLKIPTNIPMLYTKWENYYLEMLMIAGIVVYFLNFFTGKTKNQKIATAWFNSHKPILESNFSLIGDDGAKNIDDVETPLQKESEHLFTLWCSGRVCCEGMLVELKLLKRQDIVAVISNMMKPACDQVCFVFFVICNFFRSISFIF